MKQTPLLFKPHLVDEIIAGRKTQTRRVVDMSKVRFTTVEHSINEIERFVRCSRTSFWQAKLKGRRLYSNLVLCPCGNVGDLIWVKESWRVGSSDRDTIWYRDDSFKGLSATANALAGKALGDKWKSSMFMYRWASRLDLLIEKIRVERLQEITTADVKREGLELASFDYSWDQINGAKHPWSSNPFVWVIDFSIKQLSI